MVTAIRGIIGIGKGAKDWDIQMETVYHDSDDEEMRFLKSEHVHWLRIDGMTNHHYTTKSRALGARARLAGEPHSRPRRSR